MENATRRFGFRSNGGQPERAFTLIELLVVILIIGTLMAIALPLYLSAVGDSQKKSCRANLQTISNAIHAAKTKAMGADFAAYIAQSIDSAHEPDLQATPICPSGGAYSVAKGSTATNDTFKVSCTKHGSFEPGVDSN